MRELLSKKVVNLLWNTEQINDLTDVNNCHHRIECMLEASSKRCQNFDLGFSQLSAGLLQLNDGLISHHEISTKFRDTSHYWRQMVKTCHTSFMSAPLADVARWLSGRVLDLRSLGRGFDSHWGQ